MNKRSTFKRKKGLREAFTLIEVTLAVGIASIALVALMGMLPQGIRTLKRAGDLAIEARIHQQIISEISLTDWDKRFEYNSNENRIRFFDDQGIDISELIKDDPDRYTMNYVARIIVPRSSKTEQPGGGGSGFGSAPTQLPKRMGGTSYSTFDATDKDQDELQLVIVEILSSFIDEESTDAGSWDAHFDDEVNWRNIHTYQARITRLIDRAMATGT
tara:strand:- start:856 stop:1503 length:648 start_codon:yes stop_codon:yes gene_type:complete